MSKRPLGDAVVICGMLATLAAYDGPLRWQAILWFGSGYIGTAFLMNRLSAWLK